MKKEILTVKWAKRLKIILLVLLIVSALFKISSYFEIKIKDDDKSNATVSLANVGKVNNIVNGEKNIVGDSNTSIINNRGIIATNGSSVTTVNNNYGKSFPAKLTFSEEELGAGVLRADRKKLKVSIHTDKTIAGAVICMLLASYRGDPIEINAHDIILEGASMQQIDGYIKSIVRNGDKISSPCIRINAPAAFNPDQTLIVPIDSQKPVQVLEVFEPDV